MYAMVRRFGRGVLSFWMHFWLSLSSKDGANYLFELNLHFNFFNFSELLNLGFGGCIV